ncbi:MAG: hypothetical protein ACP5N0_06745 [Methanosarcina sp.]
MWAGLGTTIIIMVGISGLKEPVNGLR